MYLRGMSAASDTVRHEAGLMVVALIWGINFPIVKASLEYVGPLTFNALRFSLSGLLLGVLYYRERRRSARRPPAFSWLYVVCLGLLGHFAYQLLFIFGIDRTTSGNSAFLISSAPLWTALVVWIRGYETFTKRKVAGLVLAFLGACLLVVGGSGVTLDSARTVGNVLSLLAAIGWGSYTALSRPALTHHTPTALAFWTMLPALPLLWAVSFLEPARSGWMTTPAVWLGIVYSGFLAVGVAYVIWNVGIRYVGPSHTAVYANMVPVIALIIGVVWLGEAVVAAEITGALAILTGLFLVRR